MQYLLTKDEYDKLKMTDAELSQQIADLKERLGTAQLRIWPVRELVNDLCNCIPEPATEYSRGQRNLALRIQEHLPTWNSIEVCPQCGAPKKEDGASCTKCAWCIF